MPVSIQSNHMQIYKHEYTRIKIKSHKHVMYLSFQTSKLAHLANVQTQAIRFELLNQTHNFTKIHFRVTIPRNSKNLGFTVQTHIHSLVHFVNPGFTAISGLIQINP